MTDRGPIEALVPVTRVLENTMELMEDETEKIRMQVKEIRVCPQIFERFQRFVSTQQ